MTPTFPQDRAELADGAGMPVLGFGTWRLKGDAARRAVGWALETGYRHLDTATIYGNEKKIGAALGDSGVERDEVFVTTKCPPRNAGREIETLRRSLDALGTERVDLWLIHWPGDDSTDLSMWRAFLTARKQGLAAHVGVSNFSLVQLDRLADETGELPAVNQVEWSPLRFDRAVLDGHRERGVVLEGYSGLRHGTLDHPTVREIATELGRTAAQVLIRWHLQHGVVVIPKSAQQDRIASNADVGFELTDAQMAALDDLSASRR